MRPEDQYKIAKKKVNKKKGFYSHLSVFIAVGIFFFVLNMVTDPFDTWFFFPLLPWSVGLSIHYLSVFGFPGGALTDEWEERELEKEMRRLDHKVEVPEPPHEIEEELELKEFKKLRKEWDDGDFV